MGGFSLNQHFSGFSHPVLIQYDNLKRDLEIWKVLHVVNAVGVTGADAEDVRSSDTLIPG